MDFAKIVETYRWTGDPTPKKLRRSIGSDDIEELPLLPDSDTMSAETQPDNFVTLCELSETDVNVSSDLTVDKRLPSTFIGDASKSDDNRQLDGMLERAKARYESSLISNWYRPKLRSRGKEKARKRSRRNKSNSSAQEISIAADGYCSSSTDIGGGLVILPLKSISKPRKVKKKARRGMKERPWKKKEQQQLSNRPESEDSACRDVSKESCSSNPPDPYDMSQRFCKSHVNRVVVEKPASKSKERWVSGIPNKNNKGDVSHMDVTSRFFIPARTSILKKPNVRSNNDCIHVDGITDGTVDDCLATEKTVSKKRRESGASKIYVNAVSNADTSSSKFFAATELERLAGGSLNSDSDISLERHARKLRRNYRPKLDANALGQRVIENKDWVPPVSVHALIQEELYEDPWKVLVACMLLNKTSGTQMRKVIWDVFVLCPTPEAAVEVETEKLEEVIRSLGLQRKRAFMIKKFSRDYLGKDWKNVTELHGIGKYAIDAYAIFCEGRWQEVKPEDHKLVDYWEYLHATDGVGYAFKDERDKVRHVII